MLQLVLGLLIACACCCCPGAAAQAVAEGQAPQLPTPENHVWQRVTHEACEHVAAGKSCDTLVSHHHTEFTEHKSTLREVHNHVPSYDTPAHLCETVEKEMAKLAPHAGATEKEQRHFCAKHWRALYTEAKIQHLLRNSQGRKQEV
jgi:hypothetical protein